MALTAKNKSRKKTSGSRVAALVIFALIAGAVAGYFFLSPSRMIVVPQRKADSAGVNPVTPDATLPRTVPQIPVVPQPSGDNPSTAVTQKSEKPKTGVRLAIIIDDMGSSMSEARLLAAIKVPLTFSIIPGLHADKAVAEYAASHAIESMIHIPMQSKGWPARRLEDNGLLVAMNAGDLQERVSQFVQQFPGAVGVNNHMGSEFTEHEEKMEAVLQVVKKNDLFFIDSVTSPESSGMRVSQRLGIKAARRNVFLDNEQERTYILGQLNQSVRLARKNGSAIAICHPHPVTISTLAGALPELAAQGVQLVPVSQLVKWAGLIQ